MFCTLNGQRNDVEIRVSKRFFKKIKISSHMIKSPKAGPKLLQIAKTSIAEKYLKNSWKTHVQHFLGLY